MGATLVPYAEANLIYINSCTVKTPSQEKALYQAQKAPKSVIVILGGCVPQSLNVDKRLGENVIIQGVLDDESLNQLATRLAKTIPQNTEENANDFADDNQAQLHENNIITRKPRHDPALLPAYHSAKIADIIPLCQGCQGCCTYCKTVQSRGRLVSYPIESIIQRVRAAVADPQIQELWLTGEDTLAWGLEQGRGFGELFAQLLLEVENTPKMIRIGMTDPESVLHQQDALVKVLQHKNVYKFLHLPVQSGSDAVLQKMRRRYAYKDYEDMIVQLKQQVPGIVIATDIIVGFPFETEEDFQKTRDCLNKLKFEIVNVTQYYEREGTIAAKWEQIDEQVKKQRSNEAGKLAIQNFNREQYIGQEMEVIVCEVLEMKNGRVFGAKSYNYLSVLLEFDVEEGVGREAVLEQLAEKGYRLGARVVVKITGVTRVALVGRVK